MVVTDHQALCWLLTKRDLAGRLARRSLSIQEYDIKIWYRSGKLHDNAYCLSRCSLPVTKEQEEDHCVTIGLVGSGLSVDFGPEEEFVATQRRVPRWRRLMDQLEEGRATLKNFCLSNGRLCLQTIKNGKQYRRLCDQRSFRERVVKAYHDDLMSGHMGVRRTLTKISNQFFWERLAIDVRNYVQSCPNC